MEKKARNVGKCSGWKSGSVSVVRGGELGVEPRFSITDRSKDGGAKAFVSTPTAGKAQSPLIATRLSITSSQPIVTVSRWQGLHRRGRLLTFICSAIIVITSSCDTVTAEKSDGGKGQYDE